jgi:hypothetical protein
MFMLVFGFVVRSRTCIISSLMVRTPAEVGGSPDKRGARAETSWALVRALVRKNKKEFSKKKTVKRKNKNEMRKTHRIASIKT